MRLPAVLITATLALELIIGPFSTPLRAQAPPPPDILDVPVTEPARGSASAGAVAGAVAVNVFRIPGKSLLCGLGAVVATGLLLITFGSQYQDAGLVFREGCGGKWVIGPSDLGREVDAPKAIFSREPS